MARVKVFRKEKPGEVEEVVVKTRYRKVRSRDTSILSVSSVGGAGGVTPRVISENPNQTR